MQRRCHTIAGVNDLADRCNSVGGLPIEFVAWPADEGRREALSRAAIPRLLLVAPDAVAPVVGVDEDWIRLPATEADAFARARQLLRHGTQVQSDVPFIDAERVLHRAGSTVVLTPTEAAILSTLLDHVGCVVDYGDLAETVWRRALGRDAMDAAIYRLRRRLDGLHLHISAVRGRGYRLSL
jgi:DNA-binding response OmpR family regulator